MSSPLDLDRDRFVEVARDADGPAVVHLTAALDGATEPLAAYAALADSSASEYTFLLESAEKVASSDPDGAFAPAPEDRHARYSFVGYDPAAAVTVDRGETDVETFDPRYEGLVDAGTGDTLDRLRGALPDVDLVNFPDSDRQQLEGGLVGFLAYDAVYDLHLDEVGIEHPDSTVPDAQFVLTTKTVAFDHAAGEVSLVFTPLLRPEDDPGALYDDLVAEAERVETTLADASFEFGGFEREREHAGSREDYEEAVRACEGARPRRRQLPSRALAYPRTRRRGRSSGTLRRAPGREPVALHVPPRIRRALDRGVESRDPRLGSRERSGLEPARGDLPARREPGRGPPASW